ncbi:MAG: formyltransferase family protein [Patescibacteria group bacterium]
MQEQYTVAIAGSTAHTVQAVQGLAHHPRFRFSWILTPVPKIIGRDKNPTPNPLHRFAQEQRTDLFLINKNLSEVESELRQQERPDFLLVVDFGYVLPQWSLDLAKIAPINVHPSALPRWRGSSPGQFVLLHGEKNSAVSIMIPNLELDQGPIITTLPLTIDPSWMYPDYYAHSFELTSRSLPDVLLQLAEKKLSPQPQPLKSPTPTARRLTRDDGYISWNTIKAAMDGETSSHLELNELLTQAKPAHANVPRLITAAHRGLTPWPGIWTKISTEKGELRLKVLEIQLDESAHPATEKIILNTVQLEGSTPTDWKHVQQLLKEN